MQLGLASWGESLAFPIMFPVRILDKNGKLVKVVSSKELESRSMRTLSDMCMPNLRKARQKKKKAAWRAYACKNCGVRVKSKADTACFCSVYCAGYWCKHVGTGKLKSFRHGGLDDLPELKKKLAAVVASDKIFVKGEYKPIKRSDV